MFKQKKWCVGVGWDGVLRRNSDAQGRVDVLQAGTCQGETRARPRRGSTTASSHGRKQQRSLVKVSTVSNRQTSYSVFFAIVVLASPCLLLATFSLPAHSILHAIVYITAEATYSRRHNGCLTAGQADRYGAGHGTGRRG